MNIERINKIAFKTMGKRKSHLQREKGFIYFHCERVAKISLNLRRSIFSDKELKDEIIYVGALFHDVTKGIEPHNKTGAHMIRALLQEECTEQEINAISEIIELHNIRHKEEHAYHIKIVQDADILDHFGSLEIWLKFMYSAHTEESVFDAIQLWESEEHKKYLESSRNALNYDFSKELFDKKVEFETEFKKRFRLECHGAIQY